MTDYAALQCPLCANELEARSSGLTCRNNHHFDRAKQGYFNLLAVQHKASKQPGDDKAMVAARRDFLSTGHYQPFSDALNTLISEKLSTDHANLLDAGCGEGYYLERLAQALTNNQQPAALTGIDISKHAVQAACKRTKEPLWLVASAANAPLKSHSMDVVYSLFTPLNSQELHRLLKPSGNLIIASAGAKHLYALRELLYETVKTHSINTQKLLSDHFIHQQKLTIEFEINLEGEAAINSLLKMTPHYWRAKADAKERLAKTPQLTVNAEINLDVFTPIPSTINKTTD